jgi:putative phage-type endonuclease
MKQQSPEWFRERAKRLTASDFGSAAGVEGAYKTRPKLWKIKTQREVIKPNEFMYFGTEHEPVARYRYEVVSGNLVDDVSLVIHPDHDFLGASPDGLIPAVGLLEVKCRQRDPHESISEQFMAQIQGQLACSQMDKCHLISWSPHGYRIWEILKSNDYWNWIFPLLTEFWEFIESDTKPPNLKRYRHYDGEINVKFLYGKVLPTV